MTEQSEIAAAPHRNALIAAHQAIEAGSELLRFEREGMAGYTAFGDMEVCEKLAEALAIACNIRLRHDEIVQVAAAEYDQLTSLKLLCQDFIAGWAS
jgi:hypothetical protein